ncbi:Aminotransferase DegT [Gammaproteobacteria bacterium]
MSATCATQDRAMSSAVDLDALVNRLEGILPSTRPLSLYEPTFAGHEWDYVKACLDSGWASSVGVFVDRLEQQLATYCGVSHAVAVVNGTAALHVALMVLGVRRDEEVLLPALTFVATANAIAYHDAIPHFIDVEERTLGVDAAKLADYLEAVAERREDGCYNRRSGRRLSALIAVHTFGHPVDIEPLHLLCAHYGIPFIEDAAESLGSLYKGRHTGSFARLAALSFNGNKIVTSGGGGAILTDDPELAQQVRHLTTTAKQPHPWEYVHDQIGYNYRLPSLNAALALAQLEQIESFVERKRRLAVRYREALEGLEGLTLFREPPFARSNYWLNALLLDDGDGAVRDELLALTHRVGILTRPAWRPMHEQAMYRHCPRMDLGVAEALVRRIVCLPSSVALQP